MAEDPIRVLILGQHPLYRDGIAGALRRLSGIAVVGEAEDGASALAAIRELAPDVAILALPLPDIGGEAILQTLHEEGSATRVLVVSALVDDDVVWDTVAAGASGYLSKAETDRQIIAQAVLAIAAGETVISPSLNAGLADGIRQHARSPSLSDREREILTLAANGNSAPEIADRLVVSPTTVRTHLQNIYGKLGVSDRAAAVAEAIRHGLVE